MAETSVQSQYDNDNPNVYLRNYISKIYDSINFFNKDLPSADPSSNKRDLALISLAKKEPMLGGVLSTVVSRDKNRQWNLTGTARQVSKYSNIMLNLNEGKGWRDFISRLSTSFYNTNMGFAAEIGIDQNGVPTTMWSFDPTQLRRTNDSHKPLVYKGGDGEIKLDDIDVIYASSMPSILERDHGLGRCAVERSLRVAQLALGILEHDLEKLGAAPPKGMLLGKGITRKEMAEAIEAAKNDMSNNEREVYSNVLAIFASNSAAELDLIPFSTLPDNFNFKDAIEFIIQLYALEFNYNASVLWAVNTSNFNESHQMSHDEKQTQESGDQEFSASLREELRKKFLPRSLEFDFSKKAEFLQQQQGEIRSETLNQILAIYQASQGASAGSPEIVNEDGTITPAVEGKEPLITVQQTKILLAENGWLKPEWVAGENNIESAEIGRIRNELCSNPAFIQRVRTMPDEPIIRYSYNADPAAELINSSLGSVLDHEFPSGRVEIISESANEFTKRRVY
jgi:hypothetical protein